MLIPKSDESFPLCPLFFSGAQNERGFTPEFGFEKAEQDGERQKWAEKRQKYEKLGRGVEYSQVKESRERVGNECKTSKKNVQNYTTKAETEWPLKRLESFKMSFILPGHKNLFRLNQNPKHLYRFNLLPHPEGLSVHDSRALR